MQAHARGEAIEGFKPQRGKFTQPACGAGAITAICFKPQRGKFTHVNELGRSITGAFQTPTG